MKISTVRHPEYQDDSDDFDKWRLAYKGGRHFKDRYLKLFSTRESRVDYDDRKEISYVPAFAKAALNKVKNTFYSRMPEIKRIGGPLSYQQACSGIGGGVDLYGTSMSAFIGQDVLIEMMLMRRVGVYVDRKPFKGPTLNDNKHNKPYLYYYKAEDILTWDFEYADGEYAYTNVLLRDHDFVYDAGTGLVKGITVRFRQVWVGEDGFVRVQFWRESDDEDNDVKDGPEIVTELTRIPFIMAGLNESLMSDVCDYQISMMNIASADVNYVHKANFPFYTEEYDPTSRSIYDRRPQPLPSVPRTQGGHPLPSVAEGTIAQSRNSDDAEEVKVGTLRGRRYPKGGKPPSFIAPPTEPLEASMKKVQKMKEEVFELVDIAVANAQPQHASAESKSMDDRGLESGLSCIGLELEYLEREIAKVWAMYENEEPAIVHYPVKYTLKSDSDRIAEAKALNDVKLSTPSSICAKEIAKQIATVMLKDKIPDNILKAIHDEIDISEYVSGDPELIKIASELGMVDAVTGSNALGFKGDKVVPKAQEEHAKRLALIAQSQSSARGVDDLAPVKDKDAAAKDGNEEESKATNGEPVT